MLCYLHSNKYRDKNVVYAIFLFFLSVQLTIGNSLCDVVVLEYALGHLEAIGGGHHEMAEDEAGYEYLGPLLLHREGGRVAVEPVQLQALGHEDGLRRLLDQVLGIRGEDRILFRKGPGEGGRGIQ